MNMSPPPLLSFTSFRLSVSLLCRLWLALAGSYVWYHILPSLVERAK
jgi:hypothetical protein